MTNAERRTKTHCAPTRTNWTVSFTTWGEPNTSHHVLQFLRYSVFLCLFAAAETGLPKRCLAIGQIRHSMIL
jgi:hypothetical protein